MSSKIDTTAVILRSRPMFETGRQLHIFSKEYGRDYVQARISRSKKSGFAGQYEATNVVAISWTQGRSIKYVSQCDVIQPFLTLRKDYNAITLAAYVFDIVIKSTSLHQPHPELFDLVVQTLTRLNSACVIDQVQEYFEESFLKIEGIWPDAKTSISHNQFIDLIQDYAGKAVTSPSFI